MLCSRGVFGVEVSFMLRWVFFGSRGVVEGIGWGVSFLRKDVGLGSVDGGNEVDLVFES